MRQACALAAAVTIAAAACDLIDPGSLSEVTVRWTSQPYAVDGDRFAGLPDPLPSLPCDGPETCQGLGLACDGCAAECDPAAGECAVAVPVVLHQTVNLARQASGLDGAGQALESVQLRRVTIDYANTFGFATPAIELFVGPEAAATPDAPGVVKLGTVPPLAASTQGTVEVGLTEEGRRAFARLAAAYRQPFEAIGRVQVRIPAGASPRGRLEFRVVVEAAASL